MLEALNWKLFLFGQFPDGHIGGLAINILMSVAVFFWPANGAGSFAWQNGAYADD